MRSLLCIVSSPATLKAKRTESPPLSARPAEVGRTRFQVNERFLTLIDITDFA
jgi:hypothetical protein